MACEFLYRNTSTGLPVGGLTAINPAVRPSGSGEHIGPQLDAPRECIPAQLQANLMTHCSGNPERSRPTPPAGARLRR